MNLDTVPWGPVATAVVGAVALAAVGVWVARRTARKPVVLPASTAPTSPPAEAFNAGNCLPRDRFESVMHDGLRSAEKAGKDLCAVLVGIDNLRYLQDVAANRGAEEAVAILATRLRAQVGPNTPISRLTPEDFGLCFLAPRATGEQIVARMAAALNAPVKVAGPEGALELDLGVSVGLAVAPEHGNDLKLMLKAMAATRVVQRSGGGAHATFDPRIAAAQTNELSLARDLREAVGRGQIELFYQPKIDAKHLGVASVEALLRWRHPAVGLVSPADFVPIAERQGLIEPLGRWVADSAIKQAALWRQHGLEFGVSINVAGAQFRHEDFAARLAKSLKTHGVPANALICEIAESVAFENTAATRQAFAQLNKLGVRLAIGGLSGQKAGLAALASLTVHEVKIDRQLVADLPLSADARRDVERIVDAAHALTLRVVAEGVENEAQRNEALRLGCDELQGHLFCKPMSARAVGIWSVNAAQNLSQSLRADQFGDTQHFKDTRRAPG